MFQKNPSSYNNSINNSGVYYEIVQENNPRSNWFWQWNKSRWNDGHQLLQSKRSPTISASTTATNLSSLEFQSSSTINKFIKGMNLEENLRRTIPEIEPLQTIKDDLNSVNTIREDLEAEEESQTKETELKRQWRQFLPQLITAIAVSWVSMVIGFISAYTSPAVLSMQRDLKITDIEISWICGLMPLIALFGGLMGGPMIENLGRKRTLLVTDILFFIAWAINYFAQHYWYMYVSRMIAGCGVGIATLTLPVYLGETIQPEVRGSLGLLPTAFGNIGILVCFLLGNLMEWKGIAGIGALLTLPFLLLFGFIPETPRWFISKGRDEESRKSLEWLRGKKNQDTVNKEFDDLVKSQKVSDEKSDQISDLFTWTNIKSLLIVLGLMFFQQLSGINAIIFYTAQIFKDADSDLNPNLQATVVGVVNFISTFIATVLIDRLGRKVLLYISNVSMIVTLAVLGTYFYLLKVAHLDLSEYSWLPLASFVIYVLGFSLGFGPIPWLMMGEILPAKIRGPAASVATSFNWTCTFVVTTTFPLFKDIIGAYGTFWMFGALTVLGLVFTILFVPETRGQSLEDIERKLAGVKVRRMSSIANLKPLQSTF